MTTLVTMGPTQEPLDAMRILSNRSTGELGTRLALALAKAGHQVIALRGSGSTADASALQEGGVRILPFTTAEDLRMAVEQTSQEAVQINAIFHAAAVSDFYFSDAPTGKIPTTNGPLTLTLKPTPKLLPRMREWFPKTRIVGWKFEAAGDKDSALAKAAAQIKKCSTDACVLNGPSYGKGFGILSKNGSLQHLRGKTELCDFLCDFLQL